MELSSGAGASSRDDEHRAHAERTMEKARRLTAEGHPDLALSHLESLARQVVDEWPFDSALGVEILAATQAARQRNRKSC